MIKLDKITEIEIKDGILTISQFDNNEVILTQDNLKKLLEAINYTRCCTELKCDCGNTEDVKNIPICASCYNPHTGEW